MALVTNKELIEKLEYYNKEMIPDDVVYQDDDGDKGREKEFHITILYGMTVDNGQDIIDALIQERFLDIPIKVKLGLVSKFEQDDYDVVKIDIEEYPELQEMFDYIYKNVPNESDFEIYHPHITLSYVESGECNELIGDDYFKGEVLELSKIKFSPAEGEKVYYTIEEEKLGKDRKEAIKSPVKTKEDYSLLRVPEHQTLQAFEPEKTDITNEDELSGFPKSKNITSAYIPFENEDDIDYESETGFIYFPDGTFELIPFYGHDGAVRNYYRSKNVDPMSMDISELRTKFYSDGGMTGGMVNSKWGWDISIQGSPELSYIADNFIFDNYIEKKKKIHGLSFNDLTFSFDDYKNQNFKVFSKKNITSRKGYRIQLKSATELRNALKLIKSLTYHDFDYKVDENDLVIYHEEDYNDIKKLLNNHKITTLEKISLKPIEKPTGYYGVELRTDADTYFNFYLIDYSTAKTVGELLTEPTDDPDIFKIFNIEMDEDIRRQGLATQLFDYARKHMKQYGITLVHNKIRYEDGQAWFESLPRRKRKEAQKKLSCIFKRGEYGYLTPEEIEQIKNFLMGILTRIPNRFELQNKYTWPEVKDWLEKNGIKETS